jgi:hypothetical protein
MNNRVITTAMYTCVLDVTAQVSAVVTSAKTTLVGWSVNATAISAGTFWTASTLARVGWVERSETHHWARGDGFRLLLLPILQLLQRIDRLCVECELSIVRQNGLYGRQVYLC